MIKELQERINRYKQVSANIFNLPNDLEKQVSDNKDVLLSFNRDQMLLGRNTDGEEFTPNYIQDPYFETKEQAEAYARMKYSLESAHNSRLWMPFQLFPAKRRDTPNLIVTGPFQDGMFINVSGGSYVIGSSYADSGDIEQKYNSKVFGLADKSKEFFFKEFLKAFLIKSLMK